MNKLVDYIAARPVLTISIMLTVGTMQAGLLIVAMIKYCGGL